MQNAKIELPKAQRDRMDHLSKHGFFQNTNTSVYMERKDGQKCLVDKNGMVYYLYSDSEVS